MPSNSGGDSGGSGGSEPFVWIGPRSCIFRAHPPPVIEVDGAGDQQGCTGTDKSEDGLAALRLAGELPLPQPLLLAEAATITHRL